MTRAAPYGDAFYRKVDETGEAAAARVWPILLDLFRVASVVDVGCGHGAWLAAARRHGIADLFGIDGPWIDPAALQIAAEQFRHARLDAPLALGRRFDMALSLEVAEHLPPERAADFVRDLTGLAPLVLFSAAIPGQGGTNHVNEQWPGYWAGLFAAHGYRALDILRPLLWNEPAVAFWYKQNLLLYADPETLAARPDLAARVAEPLALVHPELFRSTQRAAAPGLGRWLKMAPQAWRRSFAKRRGD